MAVVKRGWKYLGDPRLYVAETRANFVAEDPTSILGKLDGI